MSVELTLACSVLLAGFALLTCFPAPVWVNWRFALLAGEYGHLFAWAALGLAAVAWNQRDEQTAVAHLAMVLSGAAFTLLAKPCVQAWRIAQVLPHTLHRQFGEHAPTAAPFSFCRLLAPGPRRVQAEPLDLPGGVRGEFYRPARQPDGGVPCLILIHGGGWDSGDCRQLPQLNHWLAGLGYAVAAISYRLAPVHPWPAQREDVLAAIAALKAAAPSLGIDPSRFVLIGRSAGGQIATAVGYAAGDPAIRGVAALYAPHDMRFVWSIARPDGALDSVKLMTQYLGGSPAGGREAGYNSASAQMLVRSGLTPPTLLIHGVLDTLVWQRHSDRLAARLAEAGIPHVNLALPWAVHAFEYSLTGPSGQLTRFALEWFLARTVGGKPAPTGKA